MRVFYIEYDLRFIERIERASGKTIHIKNGDIPMTNVMISANNE